MSKQEAIAPEVLAPETTTRSVQKRNAVALLGIGKITAIIRSDLAEIEQLENDALNCALRIGILQEMAKRLLPHGEFNKWRELEFDYSISTLKFYHVLALKRLAEVGLLKGHDKATPMQIPLPRDLSGLNADTLMSDEHKQMVFDWGDNKPNSIRDALDRYNVKIDAKRRGGNHGGGAAMAERSKTRHQVELEISIDHWRNIIQTFREFALDGNRVMLVPPPLLEEGLKSIRDCILQVQKSIERG